MLNVFITIDTETWPIPIGLLHDSLPLSPKDVARSIDTYFNGITGHGNFGLKYQLEILKLNRLKAVFFVEALFADALGHDLLSMIVSTIRQYGQEVQLHVHSEWLMKALSPVLPRVLQHLNRFSENEQFALIGRGLENMRRCGAGDINAFRAGTYSVDPGTLRALVRHNIRFDSSYNAAFLRSDCKIGGRHLMIQPEKIEGVTEIPISFFKDFTGRIRPTQLSACSSEELKHALLDAHRMGFYSFVIVLHNFEMLKNIKSKGKEVAPDNINMRRFAELCEFLAGAPDKFRTCGFLGLDPASVPTNRQFKPLRSNLSGTLKRYVESIYNMA